MIKKQTLTMLLAVAAIIGFAQQHKIPFEKYGVAEGLPEEVAMSPLQDDKGFIWFGTQNGLVKYDGYSFKVYRATLDKTDSTSLHMRSQYGGLLKARDGKIWMSGESSGITSFDPVKEIFRNFYPAGNAAQGGDQMFSSLLFEDEAGDIWFIAGSNLASQFTTFRLNPETGIIKQYTDFGANLRSIYWRNFNTVESSGTVWALDEKNNLNGLNRQKDSFEIVIPAGKDILLSGKADTIRQLSKASANRLLLTGNHGLYIFDSKNQKIVKSYVYQRGIANGITDSVLYAVEDLNGQYWVVYRKGTLSLIDPVSDNIQTFNYGSDHLPYQKGITEISVFFVTAQNKEGILFQAISRLQRQQFFIHYDFAKKTFSFYDYNFNLPGNPLPQRPYPYLSLQDRTGLLWLGTRPGLYKQAPKKQQMDLFRFRADEPDGLPSDSIQYLFEDSKKRLWVGTANGLSLYQADQDNFKVFRNNPSNSSSISNNEITTVQEDADGKIWVGTQNGLNQFQESTGSFKRYFYSPKEINTCTFIFPDKQQRLWLSFRDKGVFVLEKNTGKILKSFVPDDKNPASLSSKRIDVFYQDSRGNIWLGDNGDNEFGLYRLNEGEDGFTHYLPVSGDSSSISSNEISFIAEDGKQRLWIGTDGGLNLYDYDQNNFTVFRNSKLSSTNYFTTDKNGEPWFATYSSGGLVSVDVEKGIITAFDESKGLLQNDLASGHNGRIVKDEFGKFWLPTQRGLSVFDPETKSFVSYYEKDGFQPYNRWYETIVTSNGGIWIGGSHGLNRILPARLLKKDTTFPSIVITQVTINDSLYSKPDGAIFKQSVAYTNAIELKHWQKDLSFDFVALHYLRSEDNQYSWKLENYDKDWSAPSKERKASYTNLSSGKYVFRVKASNADGVWNEEGILFTVRILPPWWQTWWAYVIYGLSGLFVVWLVHKYQKARTVRIEREKSKDRELAQAKEIEKAYTELKETQKQLIQSEKMASLGELTAGIAHEIQNPLNFVNNFSEVNVELVAELKLELEKGDIAEAIVIADNIAINEEKILEHGKRADSIVKGMLQHSRSSNGIKEPTDINALADEYLRLSYHGLRAKDKTFNADFKTEFDASLPKINIIPQDIGRVLLNLINNAFYVVAERQKNLSGLEETYKPSVTITTKNLGDLIEISVMDNGNGIPEEIKKKIFQPFFTTKPTGEGTGLGLSLCFDIVKAHGGELKVETKEGEGSQFIIQIPIS
ncbi:MAG: two-component regulator propeller domain-containing protein [Bacteroidales bacterium]|nr:two-component regulator propeller domain-containing protein [Bacteroidales bacterium]